MAPERATRRVKIRNRLGLHARPAMMFVDLASAFRCAVSVTGNSQTVDGKSIMQMMMLAATQGAELTIAAEGEGAAEAADRLEALVNDGFGEE